MCGLCGIAGKNLFLPDITAFQHLLYMSSMRGLDSTGMFRVDDPEYVHTKGKPTVRKVPAWYYKKPVTVPDFIVQAKKDTGMFQTSKARVFAGHCRAATIGSVSEENAHPYNFDNIIGMHNGTIMATSDLDFTDDHDTDSEALFHNLNDYGLQETVDRIGYKGAYALVWYDKRDTTLNFLRNDQRPLFLSYNDSGDTLAWASEPWMLESMYSRRNAKPGKMGIFMLKSGMHWSCDVSLGGNQELFRPSHINLKDIKISPKVKTYKHYNWPDVAGEANFFDDYCGVRSPATSNAVTTVPAVKHTEDGVPFDDGVGKQKKYSPTPYRGFSGQYITEDIFRRVLKAGCINCLKEINPDIVGIEKQVGWSEPDKVVCPDCLKKSAWLHDYMVHNTNV